MTQWPQGDKEPEDFLEWARSMGSGVCFWDFAPDTWMCPGCGSGKVMLETEAIDSTSEKVMITATCGGCERLIPEFREACKPVSEDGLLSVEECLAMLDRRGNR